MNKKNKHKPEPYVCGGAGPEGGPGGGGEGGVWGGLPIAKFNLFIYQFIYLFFFFNILFQ